MGRQPDVDTDYLIIASPVDEQPIVRHLTQQLAGSEVKVVTWKFNHGPHVFVAIGVESPAGETTEIDLDVSEALKAGDAFSALRLSEPVPAAEADRIFHSSEFAPAFEELLARQNIRPQVKQLLEAFTLLVAVRPDIPKPWMKVNYDDEDVIISGISSPSLFKTMTDALIRAGFVPEKDFIASRELPGVSVSNTSKEIRISRQMLEDHPSRSAALLEACQQIHRTFGEARSL